MNTNSFLGMFSVDDDLAMRYSPDRMQFYANLWDALNGPDPTVVDKVLGLEMKNRNQFDKNLERKKELFESLQHLKQPLNGIQVPKPEVRVGAANVLGGGIQRGGTEPGAPTETSTWYDKFLKVFNSKQTVDGKKALFDEWKRNPVYSPEAEAVTTTDRVVFIAVTYAFRAITLYLIEWSIHNRMITSFEAAFWYYFLIYMSFFVLLVMLVNIKTENPLFRMLFYYVYTDIKGGSLRILIHGVVQFLLIIIPFILRETSSSTSQAAIFLSFEERQNILKTLSRFTLFTWILTSAIAIRV